MNKLTTIILSILGACSVITELMTPIAVVLFWGFFFDLSTTASIIILVIGGFATLFRAIKIGWLK